MEFLLKHLYKFYLVLGIVILAIIGGFFLFQHRFSSSVGCTLEAKICPDGSTVGRHGPQCEFDPCPLPISDTTIEETWASFTDGSIGVTFRYPEQLTTSYIKSANWPPKITKESKLFTCEETKGETTSTEKKMINAHTYCVTIATEGAAGSIYKTISYATEKESATYTLTMVLQYPQCANYETPVQSACDQEEKTFSIDSLVNKIFSTFVLKQL